MLNPLNKFAGWNFVSYEASTCRRGTASPWPRPPLLRARFSRESTNARFVDSSPSLGLTDSSNETYEVLGPTPAELLAEVSSNSLISGDLLRVVLLPVIKLL